MLMARTPMPVEIMAATEEPIMPQTRGNIYFKFTPNRAGSVTPR